MFDQPDSGKHYRFSYKGVKLDPYRQLIKDQNLTQEFVPNAA